MKLMNRNISCHLAGAALLALAATLPARADNYQSAILAQNPAGYWRLNETTQPALVQAINLGSLGAAANGSYNNLPVRGLPGPFTGSLGMSLDGSAQSVTTPFESALNPATFTIEAWINPANTNGFGCVVSSIHTASPRSGWYVYQDDGSLFSLGAGYVMRMFNTNGTTPSITVIVPQTFAPGTWTHIVFSFDGTTAKGYTNGVLAGSGTPAGFVPNVDAQFSIGQRSDNAILWPGQVAEIACYGTALSDARIASHYQTAMTTPASYASAIQGDSPLLYYRFQEAPDPVAANLGSLGAAANGTYVYAAQAGVPGPVSPAYAGFEANNHGVNFNGANGYVSIPALGLNTNSVTMTAWVKANGQQAPDTALVICDGGTTGGTGLAIDLAGGLQLAYHWNGSAAATALPSGLYLPDSDWAFIAMAVQPDQCALYVGASNNISSFNSFVNPINHVVQVFDAPLQIGADASALVFNGVVDEVAVFNRTLSQGEVYSEYAAAIGGIRPTIFADPLAPPYALFTGDTFTLTVDAGGTPPLAYQWRKGGSDIPGATGSAYTLSQLAVTNNGNYDVVVTNLYGSAPSGLASIIVNAANLPSISQGPQGRTLYPGGTLHLSVLATGGGLKYQWSKDGTAIHNATNSAYIVTSVTASNAGAYTVTATNGLGSALGGPAIITIPAIASGSYEAAIVADAPEAWWRLDEASGSTTMWDAMGRHDGYYTNVSGNPVTLGAAGALFNDADTAASFDGSASYGVVPFSSKLNGHNFTLECWARTTDLTDELSPVSSSFSSKGEWFYSASGSWYGGVYSGGTRYYVPSSVAADTLVSGQWTHLVMTDNGTMRIYINGDWDTAGYADFDRNDSGPLVIGAHGLNAGSAVDSLFKGQVDEVAVYTTALSQAQIQAHYQARYGNNTVAQFLVPLVPQTITPGRSVSFSTTVAGSLPVTLQWYQGTNAITGATNSTLTVTNAAMTGTYTLWATNPAGVSSISVTLTVVPTVSSVNDTNNLVLHLKFEGNANDSSGRGNHGTPLGNPTYVTGKIGSQALHYGTATAGGAVTSASYVSLGTPTDLQFGALTSFSASMWVRLPAGYVAGDLPFFDSATNSDNNLGFAFSPSYRAGGWEWCLQDGLSGVAGTHDFDLNGPADSINDGAWHHFLLTVDRGANLAITYLDGLRVNAIDITGLGSFDTGGPVTIGQDPTGAYPEAGSADIDDLGVWLRALTAVEVCNIYSAGSTAGHSFDTVPPPSITVTPVGGKVVVTWNQGLLLQAGEVTGAWTTNSAAVSPWTNTPSGARQFFRAYAP